MRPPADQLDNRRGFTLIELMIVVAVIGILAAVAGVSYVKYIKSAKISKLKQYAMEVASAQEQYKAQNSGYLDAGKYSANSTKWEQLLGFDKEGLAAQNIELESVEGEGKSGESCSICGGMDPDFDGIWYAVAVTQDMDDDSSNKPTTVVLNNDLEQPVVLNEGQ